MVTARRELDGRLTGTEVDRRQIAAHLVGRVAAGVAVAQPELALAVDPPALDASIVQDSACMACALHDLRVR